MTTVSIGNIALRAGLVWKERGQFTGVIQTERQSLGGRPHVYTRTGTGSMPITLESLSDQGMQDYSVVQQLVALASDPHAEYTLVLGSTTYPVRFRYTEQPVVEHDPIIQRSEPKPDDLCRVTLRLVTYNP